MDLTHLSSQLKLKTDFNAGSSLGLRDINSITGIVDNSVTSIKALIFANDNPKYDDIDTSNFDVTGITSGYDNKAFVFDLKKEYKLTLSSDITDHYVEDNIAIQDHIGLKPVMLDVAGSISEINLIDTKISKPKQKENDNLFNSLDSYLSRMGSLTSFAPNIVNQSLDIYNSAKFVYSTVNKIINLNKETVSKSGIDYTEGYDIDRIKQTKQFEWIDWFKTQWEHRASFTIVTPYGVFSDMYIMELNSSQPENSRYITNLNIRFKQIRRAIIVSQENKCSRNADIQYSKITDNPSQVNANIPATEENVKAWYGGDTKTVDKDFLMKNNQMGEVSDDIYAANVSNNTATASYNIPEGKGMVPKQGYFETLGKMIKQKVGK